MFSTFGYQNAYGVYQDFYGQTHAGSASAISWIGSTQLFMLTSLGIISGKLVDMGYFRQTVFIGSFLYVFWLVLIIFNLRIKESDDNSLFMLSIAHTNIYYQLFLSQGIGMGIGSGLIYIPCLTVLSHHWRARRSMAIGIVFSGMTPID
jgi:MFS family permease